MPARIWLIAGPTASGKSALALRLAEAHGGEIVNADALQLYADLRALSARPTPEEEARAPHHLFGIADADDAWSTGRWLRAATEILADIAARGRDIVVVGGTGLYFQALTKGLADIPAVPSEFRRTTTAEFEALGEAAFRERLAAVDAPAAARIAPRDRQRLVRAWEVYAASGRALSDWQASTAPALDPGAWTGVALEPPRPALYARCDSRLEIMVRDGALEETAALLARGLDPMLPAMKAVGLRELGSYVRGEADLPTAIAEAQLATRHYAKRQLTWLRNQAAGWPRLDAPDPEGQWRQFLAHAGG